MDNAELKTNIAQKDVDIVELKAENIQMKADINILKQFLGFVISGDKLTRERRGAGGYGGSKQTGSGKSDFLRARPLVPTL